MRIQKYLSDVGFCSRRQAEDFIRDGKILINDKKAVLGDKISGDDKIIIDGQELQIKKVPKKKVLVFHKPKGVECTLSPGHEIKTLLDFDFGPDRVFPIGFLDKDAHGLLLLTNDGDLGNKLTHPSSEHEEEYIVSVKGKITDAIIDNLEQGVIREGKKNVPCQVEQIGDDVLRLILNKGRNRKIRKMFDTYDLQIIDLQRIRVDEILLKELISGDWRILNDTDFEELKKEKKIEKPSQWTEWVM